MHPQTKTAQRRAPDPLVHDRPVVRRSNELDRLLGRFATHRAQLLDAIVIANAGRVGRAALRLSDAAELVTAIDELVQLGSRVRAA